MSNSKHLSLKTIFPTTQECVLVREEPIERLERIVFALSEACRQYGPAQEKVRAAVAAALAAECVDCGQSVTGDELVALSQLPSGMETSSRIKWLRLGCCARNGCDSRTYVLKFLKHPQLDWPELFLKMETAIGDTGEASELEPELEPEPEDTAKVVRQRWYLRISLAIGIVVLLYLVHQWYYGGRIPLLREPEHFRVTPIGPGGEGSVQ